MVADLFLRGFTIGASIAAPVGPIGLLCIRRTLADGRWAGLSSGLGAASADAIYGGVAGFGLTALSNFLLRQQFGLALGGGLFLCYLGLKTCFSQPVASEAAPQPGSLLAGYGSTFVLTLTNPLTILSFTAVFAGLGLAGAGGNYSAASALVAGVFAGSAVWWLTLCLLVGWLRKRFDAAKLRWLNRLSGLIIVGFGLWALWHLPKERVAPRSESHPRTNVLSVGR